MNRMADVAALFGKKLGEEFQIKFNEGYWARKLLIVKFTRMGLKSKTRYNAWELGDNFLLDLLKDRAVIVDD